jgi:ribosome biogenesis ATPase
MQGLWSTQRRTKVNLNSIPSTSGDTSTSLPLQDAAAVFPSTNAVGGPSASTPSALQNPDPLEYDVHPSKRKPKSNRKLDESNKRAKLASTTTAKDYAPPTTRLSDLGGIENCIEKMLELVAMPLCHPEVYTHTGVQPPRGVLLHGPPGCGKTLLANAMAGVGSLPRSSSFVM